MKPVVRVLPYKMNNIRWCITNPRMAHEPFAEPMALFYYKSFAVNCGECVAKALDCPLYIHNENGRVINVLNI